ncbi:MAG: Uma2 family endonuclease [Planctomycetota bacterium]
MSHSNPPELRSSIGDPAWEIAHLFPKQGEWTESDYFSIESKRPVELSNGVLEVLPMPTWMHQLVVEFLFDQLRDAVKKGGLDGKVMIAPLPVKLFPGTVREPDILYLRSKNVPSHVERYPSKLDLAIEIVSEGKEAQRRDYVTKRRDYEKAGVQEYWVVDPVIEQITVFLLRGGKLEEVQRPSEATKRSELIPHFTLNASFFSELRNS